jgi:hypothetical protein
MSATTISDRPWTETVSEPRYGSVSGIGYSVTSVTRWRTASGAVWSSKNVCHAALVTDPMAFLGRSRCDTSQWQLFSRPSRASRSQRNDGCGAVRVLPEPPCRGAVRPPETLLAPTKDNCRSFADLPDRTTSTEGTRQDRSLAKKPTDPCERRKPIIHSFGTHLPQLWRAPLQLKRDSPEAQQDCNLQTS